jgi:ketosteroid isomerase-like protein
MKIIILFIFTCFYSLPSTANIAIDKALDAFHQAAAQADGKTYLNLLTQDSIFLGTDASERWTKAEFTAFVEPYFKQGKGWTYRPTDRHVSLFNQGKMAFFDELLDNDKYGVCRGTGVLVKTDQGWKISQYNLSIPLHNAIPLDVVTQIKAVQ